jgi:hypothetical protein
MVGFETHLVSYQPLLRQLRAFRFLYISPSNGLFARATERFRKTVRTPLESDVSSEILRYFQIRKRFEERRYVVPVTADFEFLNEAGRRFHGERFEGLYASWQSGAIGEPQLRREFSQITPGSSVFFETLLVAQHRSTLASTERKRVNVA